MSRLKDEILWAKGKSLQFVSGNHSEEGVEL